MFAAPLLWPPEPNYCEGFAYEPYGATCHLISSEPAVEAVTLLGPDGRPLPKPDCPFGFTPSSLGGTPAS